MNVMVAEDDVALSLFLQKGLELDGHTVHCKADGISVLEHVTEEVPDLLVLDLGLPKMDGVDVLRALQGHVRTMSVLVLSGRGLLAQRLECLDLGADDYLIKPFSMNELTARCRAVARRRVGVQTSMLLQSGLVMDRMTRRVTFNSEEIEFTAKEFTLLEYLLLHRGRPVSRKELLEKVWRMPVDAGTNVVDVYVNYLRRKLSIVGSTELIETVRGEGYAIGIGRKQPQRSLDVYPAMTGGAAYLSAIGVA